jgi:hypothetical protein
MNKTNDKTVPQHVAHLHTYLNDHLAGMVAETALAERVRKNNSQSALDSFLDGYLISLRHEKQLLEKILRSAGGKPSPAKQGAAWISEKLGRLKLNNALVQYSDLSRLEELEMLMLGASWRRSLWEALAERSEVDSCLQDTTAHDLRNRTETQFNSLLDHLRSAAATAFQPSDESAC